MMKNTLPSRLTSEGFNEEQLAAYEALQSFNVQVCAMTGAGKGHETTQAALLRYRDMMALRREELGALIGACRRAGIGDHHLVHGFRSILERAQSDAAGAARAMGIYSKRWRFSKGWQWREERRCAADTASQWLRIFMEDEPGVEFVAATTKPVDPKGGKV